MEADFKIEFTDKYNLMEYNEIENLLNKVLESYTPLTLSGKQWTISCDIEKIHLLQYTYYISLSKEGKYGEEEISLVYENGINNGTVLLEYDFGCISSPPLFKIEEILYDIEINWEEVNAHAIRKYGKKPSSNIIKQFFKNHKNDILELYRKENYDNYFTGGGTAKTEIHYKNEKEKYHDMGLYWNLIYKNEMVQRNFI